MIAKVAAGVTALFQCIIALIEMAFWMNPKVHARLMFDAVQAEKAAPSRREGGGLTPSQRDAKAYQLIQEGNAKTTAKDFGGAAAKYQAALDLKPTKQYVGFAYRGLGTAAVFAGDTKQAVKWYKLYLPYADDATRQQVQQLIARYGE